MEGYNSFIKGLHKDFDPINQPEGTYRRLLNGIRQTNGTIENERGTLSIDTLPSGYIIIGSTVLEKEIILFLCNSTDTRGEIGVLNDKDQYLTIINSDIFDFRRDHQIDVQARKNFKSERLVYFTDDLNPMRFINLDDLPDTIADMQLQLSFKLPVVELSSINSEGTLPTGVYQFAVRLVTESTNKSPFGLSSNLIPVGLGNPNDDAFSGAPPQTESNKSITVKVSNIDAGYKFVEVIAITYKGTANTFSAYSVGLVPIQGNTSISFTYSSESQHLEEVALEEVVQEIVLYKNAKAVEQKDGVLFFSNLTADDSEYDFQPMANNIVAKYFIEEVEYRENIDIVETSSNVVIDQGVSADSNDYADPLLAANKKGYMREEVYSLALVPIYLTGKTGQAFHIPGNHTVNTEANVSTKTLGTYVSGLDYPTDFPLSGKIRHHKMPRLGQEPHVKTRDGRIYIRILGIELTNIIVPDDIKDSIAGFLVVRQARTEENKSILSQGVVNRLFQLARPANTFSVMPWSGKWPFTNNNTLKAGSFGSVVNGETITGYNNSNYFAFYSPETIFNKDLLSSGRYIKNIVELYGKATTINQKRTGGVERFHLFLNYNDTTVPNLPRTEELDTSVNQFIDDYTEDNPVSFGATIAGTVDKVRNYEDPYFLLLKTKTNQVPVNDEDPAGNGRAELYYQLNASGTSMMHAYDAPYAKQLETTGDSSFTKRELYNVLSPKTQQYGNIYDAQYIYCGHKFIDNSTSIKVYGGDTYISKFSYVTKPADIREAAQLDNGIRELFFYSVNYLFLESSVNANYRHNIKPVGVEGEEGFIAGTPDYYPKYKVLFSEEPLGLLNYKAILGHSNGYNNQYSFENTTKYYFPKQLTQVNITEFPNRTIYSDKSVEGEQFDAYRLFLPNNYHDIPKHKGEIVDTFVFNNTLYVHTSRGLWRTFVNEQTTQVSSSGEVYLGNGGLFPIPSKEVVTIDGGYAGTLSQWAGCTTPYGRFLVDSEQGKIFLLTDQLIEISKQGLFKFFQENLTVLPDNPSQGLGYISAFDYENNRWILTKREAVLRDEYKHRYMGEYIDNAEFKSKLVSGDSIVFKDGKYQIYYGNNNGISIIS